jgi:tetratricopeptide (TPR) repeat protein
MGLEQSLDDEERYILDILIQQNELITLSDIRNLGQYVKKAVDRYMASTKIDTKKKMNRSERKIKSQRKISNTQDYIMRNKANSLATLQANCFGRKPLEYIYFFKKQEENFNKEYTSVLKYFTTLYLESSIEVFEQRLKKKDFTEAEKMTIRGKEYFEKNDIDNSIQCFQEAMKISPNFAIPHMYCSKIYRENKRDFDSAEKSALIAIKFSPLNKHAWYEKAGALAQQKRYSDALKDVNEALSIDPYYSFAENLAGQIRSIMAEMN